jgi:hypothetical protein
MSESDPDDGNLEAAFVPLVQRWQAVRLFEEAADPSFIASVLLALVNSQTVINYRSREPVKKPEASRTLRSSCQTPNIADRLVELLHRAFPSGSCPVSTVEEP